MSPATKHTAILVWLVLGCTLLAANLRVDRPEGAEASPNDVDVELESTAAVTERADRAAFIDAWTRWDTGEHAVSGVLTRRTGDEETKISYRESRLDGRWLRQIGPSVVLADDQGRRVCHQDANGVFLCTTMEADTEGNEVAGVATGRDPTIGYLIRALDHAATMKAVVGAEPARPGQCWEAEAMVNDGAGPASVQGDNPWGRRSWFCFDTETGALMLRHTIMDGWTETAVARIVSGEVTELDLAPSPTLAANGAGTRG